MSDQQRDGNAPITLLSSTGDKKGQIPSRSGPHPKESLRESAGLELDRPARKATTGEHAVPLSPFPDEDGQHTSGPSKKKARPEVEAWAQDLNTGEHKLAALRRAASADGNSQHQQASDAIGIPTTNGTAKSASTDVPSWEGIESPLEAPQESPHGERRPPRARPSVGAVITMVAIGAAVVVGGFLAYKVATAPKAEIVETKRPEEDEFVRRMRAQAEGAPECWTTDSGFDFIYRGPKGENLRADRIADVPHLYRRSAKCVREQ
jgi:hypothetical protein